jgi:hypothetical protein
MKKFLLALNLILLLFPLALNANASGDGNDREGGGFLVGNGGDSYVQTFVATANALQEMLIAYEHRGEYPVFSKDVADKLIAVIGRVNDR